MIGVIGGAKPLPWEEAALLSCRLLVVCKNHAHWTIANGSIPRHQVHIFEGGEIPCPDSYKPFAGVHAICYALAKYPNETIYAGFMDLYFEQARENNEAHKAHDRALHARIFNELQRVHGRRLILCERLESAIKKLGKVRPHPIVVRDIARNVS